MIFCWERDGLKKNVFKVDFLLFKVTIDSMVKNLINNKNISLIFYNRLLDMASLLRGDFWTNWTNSNSLQKERLYLYL